MRDPVQCCEATGLQTPLSALRLRNADVDADADADDADADAELNATAAAADLDDDLVTAPPSSRRFASSTEHLKKLELRTIKFYYKNCGRKGSPRVFHLRNLRKLTRKLCQSNIIQEA